MTEAAERGLDNGAARATDAPGASDALQAARSERALGRGVAVGLPVLTVLAACVVGAVTSIGPAILVLISGVLLGAIALFWASLRTLSGDAPLPEGMEVSTARRFAIPSAEERRRTILRALKDLEHERAVGKIDDEDYAVLVADYRAQAKALMREMDEEIAPLREKAERLARAHLEKRGLLAPEIDRPAEPKPDTVAQRLSCARCNTSNEADAAFCKKCGAPMTKDENASEEATDATP